MFPVVLMLYSQYLEQYVAHSRLLTKYLLRILLGAEYIRTNSLKFLSLLNLHFRRG